MKTKQEWIDAAKAEGVKLRGAYMDDILENAIITFVAFWIGYIAHAMLMLLK